MIIEYLLHVLIGCIKVIWIYDVHWGAVDIGSGFVIVTLVNYYADRLVVG